MKTYEVEWTIDPKYYNTIRLRYNSSFYGPTIVRSMTITLVILTYFMQLPLPILFFLYLVATLFCYGILFGIVYIGSWILLTKRQQPYPTVTLIVDEGGVKGRISDSSFHLRWQKIKKVKELSEYIMIKTDNEKVLIPKGCFQTPQEVQEIIAYTKNKVTLYKRKRNA